MMICNFANRIESASRRCLPARNVSDVPECLQMVSTETLVAFCCQAAPEQAGRFGKQDIKDNLHATLTLRFQNIYDASFRPTSLRSTSLPRSKRRLTLLIHPSLFFEHATSSDNKKKLISFSWYAK